MWRTIWRTVLCTVGRAAGCIALVLVLAVVLERASVVAGAEEHFTSGASRDTSGLLPPRDTPGEATGEAETVLVDGARIHLLIEDQPFDLPRDELRDWVIRCARIVAHYYGSFPVDEAYIAIRARRGARVYTGRAFGTVGAVVNVDIGLRVSRDTLDADWVLIHEMIHLAFPSVARRHHWIEEGLSVYVESIARANSGVLSPESVWSGFLAGMPRGLPQSGDRGLDYTPTWGRTYWGGALFCLLADIRIREQTDGRKTLRDALRGIVDAGYDITRRSDLREVLTIADQATGVRVLTGLYDEMRNRPGIDDLDALWRSLGVSEQGQSVVFDEQATLGEIRRALTASDL